MTDTEFTPDIDDTPGELERLEAIIDKAAALRGPTALSEVRLIGEPQDCCELLLGVARARTNFGPIGKPATGRMGNSTYQYAPLTELVKATAAPLAAESVVVMQFLTGSPGEDHRLTTWVTNGKARIEAILLIKAMPLETSNDVKAWGALTTYLRRYTYQATLQLDGDADADSEAGDQAGRFKAQPPPLEAAPRREQRQEAPKAAPPPKPRSEPPPKPTPRPAQPAKGNDPSREAAEEFVASGRSRVLNSVAAEPQGGFAARLAETRGKTTSDDQPYIEHTGDPEDAPADEPVDRPTAPIIEVAKPSGPPADRAELFLKLAKRLGLQGPKLITWMEKRINKTDPTKVTAAEVEFLIGSANEELAVTQAP